MEPHLLRQKFMHQILQEEFPFLFLHYIMHKIKGKKVVRFIFGKLNSHKDA